MKYSRKTERHLSGCVKKEKAGQTSFLSHYDVLFSKPKPLAASMQTKPSKRPLGMDEGLVYFSEDWDSAETNQEIAQMVGMDHLDDVHTL